MERVGLMVLSCAGFVVPAARGVSEPVKQAPPSLSAPSNESAQVVPSRDELWDGGVTLLFDDGALAALDLRFLPHGHDEEAQQELSYAPRGPITFEIDPVSTLQLRFDEGQVPVVEAGSLATCGALLLDRSGDRIVLANLGVQLREGSDAAVVSTLGENETPGPLFELRDVMMDWSPQRHALQIVGALTLTAAAAEWLEVPGWQGLEVGTVQLDVEFARPHSAPVEACDESTHTATVDAGTTAATGPDVLVADLQSVILLAHLNQESAFAVGTTACNIGTARADWIANTNEHPVILQNLYRLDSEGFQQIGMSWVKHGFYAVSQSMCSPCNDPTNGSQLGVGCSDPYSASLNGAQNNMSPRGIVNGHTGYFPYPYGLAPPANGMVRRLRVLDADLNPALNLGSRYFIEGHYVTADDAAAGNQDNNASYREVQVVVTPTGGYQIAVNSAKPTRRGQAALRAWQDVDPNVVETELRVPAEGLFILGARATAAGPNLWHYSYALQNLNSDRSARAFSVPIPPNAAISNISFHDIDHHSGEVFDTTDWTWVQEPTAITWSTDLYADNPVANALRYDSIFSFSFDCNAPPQESVITIELFKPGFPGLLMGSSVGPYENASDCNNNGIHDACDVDCGSVSCLEPCGGSLDCNANEVPDECEPDCNDNGQADACDLADCPEEDLTCADCNANGVPDGCEEDCDGNGIPDTCVPPPDYDGDGINDCLDLCPMTTWNGACECPLTDRCCFDIGVCIDDYPHYACIEQGGVPDCQQVPCRGGCIIGDFDGDGDVDLIDYSAFQSCYSGAKEDGGYVSPSQLCTIPLDYDEDEDIDGEDYARFAELCDDPRSSP